MQALQTKGGVYIQGKRLHFPSPALAYTTVSRVYVCTEVLAGFASGLHRPL